VLTATVPGSGRGPHAKLNAGSQAPKEARRSEDNPDSFGVQRPRPPHFHPPRVAHRRGKLNGNRLQAAKWRQWKVHLFKQDDFYSTWSPYNIPHIHNLEWDPREERSVDFPHIWVVRPVAAAAMTFLKSLAAEPPIKSGTPDPYTPPKPGQLRPEAHLQIGPIIQMVTTLVDTSGGTPEPDHGLVHSAG
jgi:hypothetical protein